MIRKWLQSLASRLAGPLAAETDIVDEREETRRKLRQVAEIVAHLPPNLQDRIMDQAIAGAEKIRAARRADQGDTQS